MSSITNSDIAEILFQVAEYLEIEKASNFKINAYKNAAVTVQNEPAQMSDLLERGADLTKMRSIGKTIADDIEEIVRTGHLSKLQALELSLSPQIVELATIPGIGARKLQVIFEYLAPFDIEKLKLAANSGELSKFPGIGVKTQQVIKDHYA